MLVLARYDGERVIVIVPPSTQPTQIVIEQVAARKKNGLGFSRLGFEAPANVAVDREEVYLSKMGGVK